MPSQPPFAAPQELSTQLDPASELEFQQWVKQNNVPFDINANGPTDYDMRGYWQALQRGQPMARPTEVNSNDNRPHFTDYYKTPLHQSFSAGSQWAGPNAPNGRIVFDESQKSAIAKLLMGGK